MNPYRAFRRWRLQRTLRALRRQAEERLAAAQPLIRPAPRRYSPPLGFNWPHAISPGANELCTTNLQAQYIRALAEDMGALGRLVAGFESPPSGRP